MLHVYGKRRPKYFFIVNMDQAIHKVKFKGAQNEIRKRLLGFSFSINIANIEAFLLAIKLNDNLFSSEKCLSCTSLTPGHKIPHHGKDDSLLWLPTKTKNFLFFAFYKFFDFLQKIRNKKQKIENLIKLLHFYQFS